MIGLIDTHAHYNSLDVKNLNDEVISINNNKNISKIINVGIDYQTTKEAIDISLNNSKFYATMGIHPLKDGSIDIFEYLINDYDISKVVAIGETGIDTNNYIDIQIKKFISSIKLANKLKLPIIIHSNTVKNSSIDANKFCLEILKTYKPEYGFVFHCFQPDLDVLASIIHMGGYVSLGPMILKKNANKSLEVIRQVDINNLLIETDYPYLSDSEDLLIKVFEKICLIRQIDEKLMNNQLTENAKRLFYKLN